MEKEKFTLQSDTEYINNNLQSLLSFKCFNQWSQQKL